MPYKVKGKCVYKKDTEKKVGCTKGSVKKYLAALHMQANEGKKKRITKSELMKIVEEEIENVINEEENKRKTKHTGNNTGQNIIAGLAMKLSNLARSRGYPTAPGKGELPNRKRDERYAQYVNNIIWLSLQNAVRKGWNPTTGLQGLKKTTPEAFATLEWYVSPPISDAVVRNY